MHIKDFLPKTARNTSNFLFKFTPIIMNELEGSSSSSKNAMYGRDFAMFSMYIYHMLIIYCTLVPPLVVLIK